MGWYGLVGLLLWWLIDRPESRDALLIGNFQHRFQSVDEWEFNPGFEKRLEGFCFVDAAKVDSDTFLFQLLDVIWCY